MKTTIKILISLRHYIISCYFLLLFNTILLIRLSAQPGQYISDPAGIDSVLNQRGEAYIAVSLDRHKSALTLAEFFSLDKVLNDTAFFYITARDTGQLNLSGTSYTLLTAPSLRRDAIMAESIPDVLDGKAYPTWPQYLEIMRVFRNEFPEMLFIDTIGYSINNKLILAVRIQTGSLPVENRPVVFLSSTIHGDEPPGYVILLMLIDELTREYYTTPTIRELLDQVILIINPLANPDGTYFLNDSTVYGSRRNNLNNIDLNRNYPDPVLNGIPGGNQLQPENRAMADYMKQIPPALSTNIHTGAEVVNYPWDSRRQTHPDDTWFHFVSKEYADNARAGHPSYMSEFPDGITNGAAWYIIFGGRQDYVTAFLKGREITLEISNEKIPPASQLIYFYERNRQSLINYIKQATYGIHGVVEDESTGNPLNVRVSLSGHDSDYSFVFSDSITGSFRRFVKGGSYRVIFEKQGYISKIIEINVPDYNRVDLNIRLREKDSSTPLQKLICYPNPFIGGFRVEFYSETPGKCKVELFTMTGQIVKSLYHDALEGYNTIFINSISSGMYVLRVNTPAEQLVKKVAGF